MRMSRIGALGVGLAACDATGHDAARVGGRDGGCSEEKCGEEEKGSEGEGGLHGDGWFEVDVGTRVCWICCDDKSLVGWLMDAVVLFVV